MRMKEITRRGFWERSTQMAVSALATSFSLANVGHRSGSRARSSITILNVMGDAR